MTNSSLGPCTLEGKFVRLEPLRSTHAPALLKATDGVDWTWSLSPLRSRLDVINRIDRGVRAEERGEEYAFAVIHRGGKRAIGSTSYFGIVQPHKRLEIGYTWYMQEMQGTVVNPECKFLLLQHAFEDWGAVRVQLGTHVSNEHSQRAILKLGAKFEGRLRNHGIMPDGSTRDAFLYSIIASEWPEVKTNLIARIAKFEGEKNTC
jgi:N-acetyltransferase